MNAGNWLTLAGFGLVVFLAAYGFIYRMDKRVVVIEQRCVNHQLVIDSISHLNQRLDKVANDNEMFWRILGPPLAEIIHSPSAKARDELVDELVGGTIDADGCDRLIFLLTEAIGSDRWNGDKRLAGALLLARAKTRQNDLRAQATVRNGGCV